MLHPTLSFINMLDVQQRSSGGNRRYTDHWITVGNRQSLTNTITWLPRPLRLLGTIITLQCCRGSTSLARTNAHRTPALTKQKQSHVVLVHPATA